MPDISFIIPSYRSGATLSACLERVLSGQRTRLSYEVIVVNSGPERADPGPVADERLRVIELGPDPLNPGAKRNAGSRVATGRWLAFLDSDCLPDAGWLDALVHAGERTGAACVGGSVRPESGADTYVRTVHHLEFGQWLPSARPGWTAAIPGCNIFCRSSAFTAIGGFSEAPLICEDLEFCAQLRRHGYRIWFEASASVTHLYSGTPDRALEKYAHLGTLYGNSARNCRVPRGGLHSRRYIPLLVGGMTARFLLRGLLYRIRCGDRWPIHKRLPFAVRCLVAWSRRFTAISTG